MALVYASNTFPRINTDRFGGSDVRTRRDILKGSISLALAALPAGAMVSARSAQDEAPPPTGTPDAVSSDESAPLPSFAIYPKETGPRTFFDVTVEAGERQEHTVVLANAGDAELGVFVGRTFAVDVGVKVNGGLESGGPDQEKTGATTWLDYPTDEVRLDPGQGIERTFSVSVPGDATPGQYITAICFETAEPIAVPGVPNLKQNLRKTIAFYLTIPGDIRPEFVIENVHLTTDESWSGIEAEVVNTGNVLVRPEGRVTVSTTDGAPIATVEIGYDAFYAGKTGLIQTGFGDILPSGDYLVTIELRDPETGATAIVEDQPIATTTRAEQEAAAAPPVAFAAATGEIVPSPDDPQFLRLDATIANSGEAVTDAEVSLQATRDGELVENYVVVSPLSLPQGETDVSSRYVPLDGWESGTWVFTLSVQIRDRESGVAQVLSSIELGDPIVIS